MLFARVRRCSLHSQNYRSEADERPYFRVVPDISRSLGLLEFATPGRAVVSYRVLTGLPLAPLKLNKIARFLRPLSDQVLVRVDP